MHNIQCNLVNAVGFFIMVKMVNTLLEKMKCPYLFRRDALMHF